jgi:signal transduction histidine kinase
MPPHPFRLCAWIVLLRSAALVAVYAGAGLLAARGDEIAPAPVLTQVADIFQVPRDTDKLSFPVEIDGVVIFTALEGSSFFIHDGQMGIHVSQRSGPKFKIGDRVRVIGDTRRGRYAPSVIPREILLLGEGVFPSSRPASFNQMASGSMDSQWVEIEGVVCSVSVSSANGYVMLDVTGDGGRLRIVVGAALPSEPERLLDCEVRLRGVATGRFNKHGQMVEPMLLVPGNSWVTVTRAGPADPFALPVRTVSRLMEFSLDRQPQHRVKVQGVVTRRISDTIFFLRDEGHGLKVETRNPVTLQSGDRIEAAGFPVIAKDEVVIQNAVQRIIAAGAPPAPVRSDLPTLLNGSRASDLVSIKARLVDWVADGSSITLILEAGNRLFKGLLQRPAGSVWTVPEKDSLVNATGICVISELEDHWSYQPRSFLLLMAAPEDLRVLQSPPWWTAARLWRALWLTLALLAAGAGWVWALQRQVQRKRSLIEHQASHAAVLEERSRIARDLHDTLEQGLTGVSLQLKAVDTDMNADPQRAHARLQSARDMLRQSRAIAHNAIRELRVEAVGLEHKSFLVSLGEAVEMWNKSGALAVRMHVTGDSRPLPGTIEHHLIGIGTEAMTNAVKHGRAGSVRIEVSFGAALVTLRITDDGHGFDPATVSSAAEGCFGLVGMRERVAEMAARITVQSRPGDGTTILVEVPLSANAARPVESGVNPAAPFISPAPAKRTS